MWREIEENIQHQLLPSACSHMSANKYACTHVHTDNLKNKSNFKILKIEIL